MLHIWKRAPMLKLLPPMTGGILLNMYVDIPVIPVIFGFIVLLLTLIYYHFFKKIIYFQSRHHTGIISMILFLFLGFLVTEISDPLKHRHHYLRLTDDYEAYRIKLTSEPQIKEKTIKVKANVICIYRNDSTFGCTGGIMLYLQKDSLAEKLHADDELILKAKINQIPGPANPMEFNYRQYLHNQGIARQVYAKSDDRLLAGENINLTLTGTLIRWREFLLTRIEERIDDREIVAVLAALILGKTDDIGYDLMRSYSTSGVVHVLAVSGLHVGLIYALINKIFNLFASKKQRRALRTFIPLLLLWTYAAITGMSASVFRSAIMFSCFIVAENWNKNNNIYNTMCFSAMIVLLINPMMLLEIGFQLSYLAVFGIVALQKKIADLFFFRSKFLSSIWNLSAVSIAAQIATLPVTLYYFHQFPVYFLLSNLLIIPLSTILLYTCIAFFPIHAVPMLSDFVINAAVIMTQLMNQIVRWFDQLPFSVIDGIQLSGATCILLSILLFTIAQWFFWKNRKAIIYVAGILSIWGIVSFFDELQSMQREEICIHNVPGALEIQVTAGNTGYVFYSNQFEEDKNRVNYHLKNYRVFIGCDSMVFINVNALKHYSSPHVFYNYPIISTYEQTIILLNSDRIPFTAPDRAKTIYIACDSLQKVFWNKDAVESLGGQTIVYDSSYKGKSKNWLKKSLSEKADQYELKDGALILRKNSISHFSQFY